MARFVQAQKNSLVECVVEKYERDDGVCSSGLFVERILRRANGLQNEEDQTATRCQEEERPAASPID